MTYKQITDKIYEKGFHRCTVAHDCEDSDGMPLKVFDFEHKRRLDKFSIYLDEFDEVKYVEFTKVTFNPNTERYTQNVTRITNNEVLKKYLA